MDIRSKVNTKKEYFSKLAATRDADAKHNEYMVRIASEFGLTLDQLRGLKQEEKENLILKYSKEKEAYPSSNHKD